MATDQLEKILGLSFRDRDLLRQALAHRSYLNEQDGSSLDSYERMEFLGDAVLELVVSNELYQRLPHLSEGELTKARAALVCRESLSQLAQSLSLGEFLLLGKGEEAGGGRQRESLLAAVFEAVVAAIYLDQGYDQARRFILSTLTEQLDEVCRRGTPPENPKSKLQEMVQRQGLNPPKYRLVSSEGPDHGPVFTVEVLVDGRVVGDGAGGKKSEAEGAAAEAALAAMDGNT